MPIRQLLSMNGVGGCLAHTAVAPSYLPLLSMATNVFLMRPNGTTCASPTCPRPVLLSAKIEEFGRSDGRNVWQWIIPRRGNRPQRNKTASQAECTERKRGATFDSKTDPRSTGPRQSLRFGPLPFHRDRSRSRGTRRNRSAY